MVTAYAGLYINDNIPTIKPVAIINKNIIFNDVLKCTNTFLLNFKILNTSFVVRNL